MGFELDDIPGHIPVPKSGHGTPKARTDSGFGFELNDIPNVNAIGSNPILGGPATNMKVGEFRFQPRTDVDNYKLRAQNQKWYEQLGLAVGNGIINVGTGLGEMVGYMGALVSERNSDRDYSNALTRQMQEWHNPLGEIYAENPDNLLDWKDSAFWFSNLGQLAESATTFGIGAAGLGALFGKLALGAARTLSTARTAMTAGKIARGAAQTLTAGTLAYTEGAMSGYRTYDAAYEHNYQRLIRTGMDTGEAHEQARKIASDAAARVVQMNTIMNTALNLTALAPMFRNTEDLVLAWAKKNGKGAKIAGETTEQWASRIKAANWDNPELKKLLAHRHGITSLTSEAIQEGVEEVNTQYAEAEGERMSQGQNRSMLEALTDIEQYFRDVTNQEGALNFMLGAAGGVAQTVLLDRIPTRKIARYGSDNKPLLVTDKDGQIVYEDGKPKIRTKLVSARTYNENGTREYFENIKDAILKDIERFQDWEKQLAAAVAEKNHIKAEEIRTRMFAVNQLNAVATGLTESWQQQFREIAELDNTNRLADELQPEIDKINATLKSKAVESMQAAGDIERLKAIEQEATELDAQRSALLKQQMELRDNTEAMQRGFAINSSDNSYKTRAEEAVIDLAHLQKIHDKTQKEYVDETNPYSKELADHLYLRQADLYLRKKALDKETLRLEEESTLLSDLVPEADVYNMEVKNLHDKMAVWDLVIEELDKDIVAIQKAAAGNGIKTLRQMVEKYRAVNYDETDLKTAIEDMVKTIKDRQSEYNSYLKESEQTMLDTVGYAKWQEKNPDKKFEDFMDQIVQNDLHNKDKANLEKAKIDYQISSENYRKVATSKGSKEFMKAAAQSKKAMIDAINKRNQTANTEAYLKMQEKKAAATMNAKTKRALQLQLEKQLIALRKEIAELKAKSNSLQMQIDAATQAGRFKNFNRLIKLRQDKKLIDNTIATKEAQVRAILQQAETLQVQLNEALDKQQTAESETLSDMMEESTTSIEEDQEKQEAASIEEKVIPEEKPEQSNPEEEYDALLQTLPVELAVLLDDLEFRLRTEGFSYGAVFTVLAPYVQSGTITQEQRGDIAVKLRDLLGYKRQTAPTSAVENVEESVDEPDQSDSSSESEMEQSSETKQTTVSPEIATTAESALTEEPAPKDESVISADDIPQLVIHDGPVIFINESLFTDEAVQQAAHERSQKSTTAIKGNYGSLVNIELEVTRPLGKFIVIRNEHETDPDSPLRYGPKLDPNVSLDLLKPGVVSIGDEVVLSVDAQWQGQVNYDNEMMEDEFGHRLQKDDAFSNYTDGNGKIRMDIKPGEAWEVYGNVPIKIVHTKTGAVTYLPRVSWINAQQGQGYRNFEDMVDGVPGNVAFETERLMNLRRYIAEQYNNNPGFEMKTRVSDRTDGHLMYSGELNMNTGKMTYKKRLAAKQLPDPSLEFGILDEAGNIITGIEQGANFDKPTTETDRRIMRRGPVVMLPLPNGKYQAVPLQTRKLSERQGDLNTVIRAIELYLQHETHHITEQGKKQIEQILEKTTIRDKTGKIIEPGFDLRQADDLNDFINQYYTHTSSFEDSLCMADAKVIKGKTRTFDFLLSVGKQIDEHKAEIKIGVAYSDNILQKAKLDSNGKLSADFRELLTKGLERRFKNVTLSKRGRSKDGSGKTSNRIKGVNDARPITSVMIKSDGSVASWKYSNYNEYLKSFTETAVFGKHRAPDGTYLYAVNSQVILEAGPLHTASAVEEFTEIELPVDTKTSKKLSRKDMIDLSNANPIQQIKSRQVITPEGTQLNLETLQELSKFTETSEHNGKKPEDVLKELQQLGITSIADGFNPFIKC